ncbi:MAG: alpha/beta fold hydrolase [Proteobacteria bacterium]|nr:alpha/beta fold hydrolase [Pseudomonadota bacterium]
MTDNANEINAAAIRIGPEPNIAIDHMGRGPLVVFLHGIGGNRTNWRDQLPEFGKHFTAAAWDARGWGDSDDYEGPLRVEDMSNDLGRVLDHFGATSAHLVGLSMGGLVVQDFCARNPGRVATMILVDTNNGPAKSMNAAEIDEFVRLRRQPLLDGKTPADIAEPVARSLVSPTASEAIVQRMIDSMSALHKDSYIKAVEAIARYEGPDLSTLRAPSLLVVGADDTLTPPSVHRAMADQLPQARYLEIPDAGHLCNIEKPAEFNQAVLTFLFGHRDRAL